jgi:hypothetical protein
MTKTNAKNHEHFINDNKNAKNGPADLLQDGLTQYTDDRGTSDGQVI